MDEKKQIWRAIYRRNTGNYGDCRPSNNKKATKFEIRLFSGTYTSKFPLKVAKLKYDRPRDSTH